MYLQLTTRCNMNCEHCCNNCTAKGEDMDLETFRAALKFDDMISLGGGEPTLHPLFWQILGESIAACEYIWLATNGSQTDIALALAKMARKGVIGCALSQDSYHDPIDEQVIQAFTEGKKTGYQSQPNNDSREIRNVDGKEINAGRCDFGKEDCCCPEPQVKPNGNVHMCGCPDAPLLFNVLEVDDFDYPEDFEHGECYKNQPQPA